VPAGHPLPPPSLLDVGVATASHVHARKQRRGCKRGLPTCN
jgi:hypothetical protein